MKKTVLVGMSGGVDSAVAAFLLKEEGFAVVGVTFRLRDASPEDPTRDTGDIRDARQVCETLGIPHHVLDLRGMFQERVVGPFVAAYARGLTPNPCVGCNRDVKMAAFLEYADEMGAGYVSTGHYANVVHNGDTGRWELQKGTDAKKDQSYFLYALTQRQLSRLLLPLGRYTKGDVRRIAEENGLVVARKLDSQDICFIPEGDYPSFLAAQMGKGLPPGFFVDEEGRALGPHRGIGRYTLGQRKGLGIALGRPMFVSAISPADNTVTLVAEEEKLFIKEVGLRDVNLVALCETDSVFSTRAKIRSAQEAVPCKVALLPEGKALLSFTLPVRAPAPGQSAVFYKDDVVLGGGVIE